MHSASSPPTYQSEEEETNYANPPEQSCADDVAEPHGAHGHHEEVDALPVAHVVHLGKVGEVASVLQLISCKWKKGENGRDE